MFLGTIDDGLYKVRCPVTLDIDYSDRVGLHQSADGSQAATVFGGLAGARSWSVGYAGARPQDLTFLGSFADSRYWYARGQVVFLPPGAEMVNVLNREESTLVRQPMFRAEPVTTDMGPVFGHVSSPAHHQIVARQIPLPLDATTVVFSAYGVGRDLELRSQFRGPGGNVVKGWRRLFNLAPRQRFNRVSERVDVAGLPAGTRFDMLIRGDFTAPAVTVGPDLYAYGTGQRVDSVIVVPTDGALQYVPGLPDAASYTKQGYKIIELRQGDFL
ncbi:hypothetical protein ACIGDM_00940 [Rothia koreensis]|uniref:hypothetical protein n=1 Tax=Rothia koreensis TaxID=592378 RepID=UPI0037CC0972